MRLFTHRHRATDERDRTRAAGRNTGGPGGPGTPTERPPARGVAHVRQDNGELVEDVVQTAVVQSTAIGEAGGLPDVEPVDEGSGDRILWIAPLPKDGEVPVEPTGQARRMDPDDGPDDG
jgi:hypothetical protein